MGRHPKHVRARAGGRGRHRALRCRGVAVRPRRRVRAVPDLRQRVLALRAAPGGHRSRLPGHVRRPCARPKDAAMTNHRADRATPHTYGANMTRSPRPLVALALAGLIGLISAGCGSNASSEGGIAGTTSSDADTKLTAHDKAV